MENFPWCASPRAFQRYQISEASPMLIKMTNVLKCGQLCCCAPYLFITCTSHLNHTRPQNAPHATHKFRVLLLNARTQPSFDQTDDGVDAETSLSLSLHFYLSSPPLHFFSRSQSAIIFSLSQLQLNVVGSVGTLPTVCDTFCLTIDPAVGRWMFRFRSLSLSPRLPTCFSIALFLHFQHLWGT